MRDMRSPSGASSLSSGVILITGVMAAGKSTVAELVAKAFPRAVHVRGDVFRRFVVSGRVEPTPETTDEAREQLLLRYRLAAATADAYVDAGFVAVVQDVVLGPVLHDVVSMVRTRPLFVVVLDPTPEAVAQREAGRPKTGYGKGWDPAGLVEVLRQSTPRVGLRLDSTDLDPGQTARAILARLEEARIDSGAACLVPRHEAGAVPVVPSGTPAPHHARSLGHPLTHRPARPDR